MLRGCQDIVDSCSPRMTVFKSDPLRRALVQDPCTGVVALLKKMIGEVVFSSATSLLTMNAAT